VPQVVGGTGFIVSSLLFMLETQRTWWRPALDMLGWHIGFWNFIGAVGFTLCGALGFASANSDAIAYATALATFIGSWAFLVRRVSFTHLPAWPSTVSSCSRRKAAFAIRLRDRWLTV